MDFAIKLEMPLPKEAPHKISTFGQAVSKKKIFDIVDDDGRTTDSRAPNSAVHGQISWNSELNRDLMAVLVTWKNKEDLTKITKLMRGHHFPIISLWGFFQTLKGR